MRQPKRKKPEPVPKADVFTRVCYNCLGIAPVKEFKFHATRKWRFDYALPQYKIALEVEGGVWTQGRHTRPQGFLGDVEKYNTATLMGWQVYRTTPSQLITGATVNLLKQAIFNINKLKQTSTIIQ